MRSRSIALVLGLLAALLIFPTAASAQSSAEICDTDAIVEAVQGGDEAGTLEGMADDPVGTAASNNPVLTTLTTAVDAAGLVDTLNSAEALTVFAPTDCAFAAMDAATLDAALADPSGLLTTVLGYHVIAGQQLSAADLSGEYETFTGETITVTPPDVDGQAQVLVPDVMTANATVHLIDSVLLPPSVTGAAAGGEDTSTDTDAGAEEGDAEGGDDAAADTPTDTGGDDAEAPTGGVATGAGGTASSGLPTPLVAVGVLGLVALGGALIARRAA
ncbi:fasciclin domain-containing protein [Euzebya tangerina]|uniref:fasciclin domain-containing protein n=1 Tax=Euzebya tangerina TaxID=591198 RepID=UPI000E3152AF|nr:fasciclin domain-containing protein [Euzebya tangerina]